MRHNVHTTVRNFVLAGVTSAALISPVVATARPAVDAQGQAPVSRVNIDLRSPDGAQPFTSQPVKIDLRSPDAAQPFHSQPAQIDLRSPDAALPVVTTVVAQHPASRFATHDTKFDVGDAAIGAGVALLIALACGGSLYTLRRRHTVSLSH